MRNIRIYWNCIISLGWGVFQCEGKNGAISKREDVLWNGKIVCEEASQKLLRSFRGLWRVLWRFYSEKWGCSVWEKRGGGGEVGGGRLVKILWDFPCVMVLGASFKDGIDVCLEQKEIVGWSRCWISAYWKQQGESMGTVEWVLVDRMLWLGGNSW